MHNSIQASEYLLDVYSGFPFVDAASKANAIGLAFTAAALRVMRPNELVPVHAGIATAQGSGKTVVTAELPGVMSGGYDSPTFTEDDGETRKVITTTLTNTSARVLCWDNVDPADTFESGVIAKLVTSTRWSDRLLGGNTQVSRPQDRVWTVTGNNLKPGRDMAARTVPIHLDARMEKPGTRQFEVRLDDEATLRSMRPALIRAVLTIVRAWVLAGSPEASNDPTMRQFTAWARRCGGLLEFIGVEGHLGNLDSIVEQDSDSVALGVLYKALREVFDGKPFTTVQAFEVLDANPHLDEHLPSWVAERVDRVGVTVAGGNKFTQAAAGPIKRSLGNTFSRRKGEFHGGLAVERAGRTVSGSLAGACS